MNDDQGNKAIGVIRDTGLSPACGLNVIRPSMNSTDGLSDMATGHSGGQDRELGFVS